MDLQAASWTDFRERPPDVALVPTGSLEQHGPHAPLGADRLIAETVAERTAARADDAVARTPAIPVGISEEHRHFAGTLWVSPDTFRAYAHEIVSSLATHGVDGVVFVNGHGGNVAALAEVAARSTRDGDCRTVAYTWFEALEDPPEPMGHAGALETAALLAIDPDLIDRSQLDAAAAGASDRWGDWVARTNLAVDTDEFADNGVVGDPRLATAELGEELLEEAVDGLLAVIDGVRARVD